MWKFLENYFTFTRSEKNGIVILISVTIIVLLAAEVYVYLKPARQTDNSQFEAEIKAFQKQYGPQQAPGTQGTIGTSGASADTLKSPTSPSSSFKKNTHTATEFYFDPNTIGVKQWMQLGFTERQAMAIEHYKQAGGVFRKPKDIKKLYVMSEENYERLLPYVRIKEPTP